MGAEGGESETLGQRIESTRDRRESARRFKRLPAWRGAPRGQSPDRIFPSKQKPPPHRETADRAEQAAAYLSSLRDKDVPKVFDALFPGFPRIAERAWREIGARPYQVGMMRKPFRAPRRADVMRTLGGRFVIGVWDAVEGLDADLAWVAAWSPHMISLRAAPNELGWVLATALRAGGPDAAVVRTVLTDSINGTHEIGQMGRHAIVAFLNSSARDDWEVIGNLLLTAQRQEGLRQSILESADEANPDAFRYLLGLIEDHDLHRFSATVRAFDVWLGMQWSGGAASAVRDGLRMVRTFLDDPDARARALRSDSPEEVSTALWTMALDDAESAVDAAATLMHAPTPELRYVALRMLAMIDLLPDRIRIVADRLSAGEPDDRVRMALIGEIARTKFKRTPAALFDVLARIFHSMPERATPLPPIVWPWAKHVLDRGIVAEALRALAPGAPEKLVPFVPALDAESCVRVALELAGLDDPRFASPSKRRKPKALTGETRTLMQRLAVDTRETVSRIAFRALEGTPVTDEEVEFLVGKLHRTGSAFRLGAISRLTSLPDARVLEIAARLVPDANTKMRAAGLELADHLVRTSKKHAAPARALAAAAAEADVEGALGGAADRIVSSGNSTPMTFNDALGLVPPGSRATPIVPVWRDATLETAPARKCIQSLADLFLENAEVEIRIPNVPGESAGEQRTLLGAAAWGFPTPKNLEHIEDEARDRLPLAEVWAEWVASRPRAMRDADGLEVVRAWTWFRRDTDGCDAAPRALRENSAWNLRRGFESVLGWVMALSRPADPGALLVQLVENEIADHPRASVRDRPTGFSKERDPVRGSGRIRRTAEAIGCCADWHSISLLRPHQVARLAGLQMIAMDGGRLDCEWGPSVIRFVQAYREGLLNDRDFVWLLVHHRGRGLGSHPRFGPIGEVSRWKPPKPLEDHPKLLDAVREVKARLVEIELTRGEQPTLVSHAASELRHTGGADVVFRAATALGRDAIVRHHEWGAPTRGFSLSRIIAMSMPGPDDTPERFAELFRASSIKRPRIIEIAMFAPQWAHHVEHALECPGLEDAIWWIHAHTKTSEYWRGDFRDQWASRIAERTELDADDLEQGAVDVAWFRRVIAAIGVEAWDALRKPARFASNSGGHKRAELFGEALLGRVSTAELRSRIDDKRNQDAVRALGLVPLPDEPDAAKAETLARYVRMQEFRRESRKFGSQRQASEGRAVDIGLQNLARTAGYRDPRRLEWAMEAHAVADLAKGPVVITEGDTSVSLAIDADGGPELSVTKKDRALKEVPAALRKHPGIAELRSRVTDLRRQASRMRLSLEESMCRGDEFTRAEVLELFAHPMLRPMLERIVLLGSSGAMGYPESGGAMVRDHAGHAEPIGTTETVRIAHPIDLLARDDWHLWQRDCFTRERVQPFKQVFREVYPKTAAELAGAVATTRYEGHQVHPRQALALLRTRMWVFAPEEGVRRVFHDERVIAELWFTEYFATPAEVEGLTVHSAGFSSAGKSGKRLLISEVPDRVFSETMRDLDLVVSVAHAGGVDPEASASTIEMRTRLVTETCRVLGLSNVRIDGHHAIIDGTRATYGLHLGSASTHVTPGRRLVIVAVHSQHRGRLFLPFADNDPKSAEVLTKVILLARDDEIRDPSILEQIPRRAPS